MLLIALLLLPLVLSVVALVSASKTRQRLEQRIENLEQRLYQLYYAQRDAAASAPVVLQPDTTPSVAAASAVTDAPVEATDARAASIQHTADESPTVSQPGDVAEHADSITAPVAGKDSLAGSPLHDLADTQSPPQQPPQGWPQRPQSQYSQPHSASSTLEPDEQSLSVVTSVWHSFLQWFKGGNAIVRVGILVLLIGVVLLLRLATDMFTIPIEVRLGAVAAGGVGLTLLGLRLREKRPSYAITIQGAGLAIVYLTLFAAFRHYEVLPAELTFILLAILAVISAGLALLQNALPLALVAFGGAFLAPLLTSSGSNNVVGLFSYYLMLNAALAWMAHYRTWKVLNALGAALTFGVAGFWGLSSSYDASLRWQLEGLLLAHLALYLFIVVRYSQQLVHVGEQALQAGSERISVVDSGLLFGVPLMGFALQAGLLHHLPYALAVSSAALSAIYLALGYYLFYNNRQLRLLTEGVLALGIGFMALVMPLAFNASWTSVGWSIQGTALIWLGIRQQRVWSVRSGLLLLAISAISLWWSWIDHQPVSLPLTIYVACLLIAALLLRDPVQDQIDRPHHNNNRFAVYSTSSFLVLVWAYAASQEWVAQLVRETLGRQYWFTDAVQLQFSLYSLVFVGITALLFSRMTWSALIGLWRLIFALLSINSVLLWLDASYRWLDAEHILTGQLVFMLGYALFGGFLLWKLGRTSLRYRIDQALLLTGLAAHGSLLLYLHWTTQPVLSFIVLPLLLLALLLKGWPKTPYFDHVQVQRDLAPGILAVLAGWALWANWQSAGVIFQLPYIPVVNGLDICLIAILLIGIQLRQYVAAGLQNLASVGIAGIAFWTLTGMVIRTLHEWASTPLWPQGAWNTDVVQTSLTIVWTLFALLLTGFASRLARRALWLAGIALLVMVVVKLIVVDLSNVGTVARIVSFIGAGLIMLLIGYIAPLPPAVADTPDAEPESEKLPQD